MIDRIKYPKIYHLPWSLGVQSDDIIQHSLYGLKNCEEVIVTEKLDGENCSMYYNYSHARSIDGNDHSSRHYIKKLQFEKFWSLPDNMRIVGENLFAKHSIYYDKLPDYFLAFAVFIDDICISWDDVIKLSKEYDFKTVPVLYRGVYDEKEIKKCWTGISKCGGEQEGYVVRNSGEFSIDNFTDNILKYVRVNHVQTDSHWIQQKIIQNKLEIL